MTNRILRRRLSRAAVTSVVIFAAGMLRTPQLYGAQQVEKHASVGATHRLAAVAGDTAVFAGGCFWGIEAVFEHLKGVTSAVSGYTGGSRAAPSYEEVSSGATGHAESVQVVYDPAQITYAQLLQVFFTVAHDPTQRNRQGPDVGSQYRSAVFYRNKEQRQTVEGYVAKLGRAKTYARPIVTEIMPLHTFYPAEDYHQNYMARHPTSSYIVINDAPKIKHLRQAFPDWYQEP